jgi:N-methylhydantoinase A/oxoprolinase/acetone carboxylase beta subunit
MENYNIFKHQIDGIIYEVENGEVSALNSYIELKRMSKELDEALKSIKDEALSEAEAYGKGEQIIHGAVVSVRAVGGKWKFDHLVEWKEIEDKKKAIEAKYKNAFKNAENGLYNVAESTGEILELPSYSAGPDAIILKFPKP